MELITAEELGNDFKIIFDRVVRNHEVLSVKGKENRHIVIMDADYYKKLVKQTPDGQAEEKQPRPLGLAKEIFQVPPEFFDELPEDLLDEFEGKAG
jgi:uncharacterized linocin/CFP29 family protein